MPDGIRTGLRVRLIETASCERVHGTSRDCDCTRPDYYPAPVAGSKWLVECFQNKETQDKFPVCVERVGKGSSSNRKMKVKPHHITLRSNWKTN